MVTRRRARPPSPRPDATERRRGIGLIEALDAAERRIRELETDLLLSRMALMDLAPPALRTVLEAHHRCDDRRDLGAWERWAVELVVRAAKPVRIWEHVRRSTCPLCEPHGDVSAGVVGYAYPIGLERHLFGSHRMRRCPVLGAAWDMKRDDLIKRDRGGPRVTPNFDRGPKPWEIKPPEPTKPLAPVLPFRRVSADCTET